MKKIMFSDAFCLTQAVLTGVKTMTRRKFARFRPDARMFDEICNIEGGFDDKGRYIFTLYNENGDIIGDMIPHYNVGEVVAIAQPYKDIYPNADFEMVGDGFMKESAGWTNKMLVRANLMKRHIRITDIKVERLQDISDDDALKEGVFKLTDKYFLPSGIAKICTSAREAFSYLIDAISGKGTWESNPWGAAYSFELVD